MSALEEMPEIRIFKDEIAGPVHPKGRTLSFDITVNHEGREMFRQRYETALAQTVGENAAYRASIVIDDLLQDAVDHQNGHAVLSSTEFDDRIVIIMQYDCGYNCAKKSDSFFDKNGKLRTGEFKLDGSYDAEHERGGALVKAYASYYSTFDYGRSVVVHVPRATPTLTPARAS